MARCLRAWNNQWMPSHFEVTPRSNTPEDLNAAATAQKLLDAIPQAQVKAMARLAAKIAAEGTITGIPPSPQRVNAEAKRLAERFLRNKRLDDPLG